MIFDNNDYRRYLNSALNSDGRRSGVKTQAAEAMGCQLAFLSRVLSGKADLSLEQADKLSGFLRHDTVQHHYFLLLVQHARAGSTSLKRHFRQLIDQERTKRLRVTEQIKPTDHISVVAESRYYSSWIYPAIHVLLSIESLQVPQKIAQALQISEAVAMEALQFLSQNGMARREGERFLTGHVHVHLRDDSDHILRHHSNLRLKSMECLVHRRDGDVRYSGFVTLDNECVERVRESLLKNLSTNLRDIATSPAKEAYLYNLDFLRLT